MGGKGEGFGAISFVLNGMYNDGCQGVQAWLASLTTRDKMKMNPMRSFSYALMCCSVLALTSCASMFYGKKGKVVLANDQVREPVTIAAGNKLYEGVTLPYKLKVKPGYSSMDVTVTSHSYEPYAFTIDRKFNGTAIANILAPIGFVIDAATGAIMCPSQNHYYLDLKMRGAGSPSAYPAQQAIVQPVEAVTRDNPGATDLEGTIIRWYIDSDPRGARLFWRVISSVPEQVKNTNETYLMTTPYEETRAFNILGLTYENSKDVQIEIKVQKRGYEDQVKRFNVRQAIDQQEISTFFELIPKSN